MLAERVFAFALACFAIGLGGWLLYTGRFTVGSKGSPIFNLLTILRTTPVQVHPTTARFIGLVVFSLGSLLLVRVFV